jgi:hypothetical protein
MRRAITSTAALLACAGVVCAGGALHSIVKTLGTYTAATGTCANLTGYLDEVQVSVSDGVSTGTVSVTLIKRDAAVAAVVICTNSVSDEKCWRPAVDATDSAGSALSSDPPRRYYLYDETLRMTVRGSPTNKVWTMRAKTTEQ